MSEAFVLDASALLCLLQDEPGAAKVEAALPFAVIGAVNLAEVATKLHESGLTGAEVAAVLGAFDLDAVPFDRAQAMAVGALRRRTRNAGLSLGDRACLALAAIRGATALTADREWARANAPCRVELLR